MIDDALTALLSGEKTYVETMTGLRFQFRQPDEDNPDNRLLCYRVGRLPTIREFTAVRRVLEAMRPGADIKLLEPLTYTGNDGKKRHGRIFFWTKAQAVQSPLF
ncbi:MAG: hypothetical protein IAE79_17920 [Anaerolinea sp.]|nr:hypothetical protein [Anaerolinea sp.]